VTERKRASRLLSRSDGIPFAATTVCEEMSRSTLTPVEYSVLDDRLIKLRLLLQKLMKRLDLGSSDYWTLNKTAAMIDRMRYELEQNQTQHTESQRHTAP
jgi:sensor histidine kinase YesM